MRKNLLEETLQILEYNNKNDNDVKWVGNLTHKTTWEDFKKIADTEYNSDFGRPQVVQDLMIVGEDWWLERGEYNGQEWWEYRELPKEPTDIIELKALTDKQAFDLGFGIVRGWDILLAINRMRPL